MTTEVTTEALVDTLPQIPPQTTRVLCGAKTKSGNSCRGWPDSSGFCPAHRPGHTDNARIGGRHSSLKYRAAKRLPDPLAELLTTLQQSISEVHSGQLSPGAGSAISSLVSASVKLLEYGSYDKRLQQLEDDLREAGLL